ncbi:MAG TPA: hypothetical protein VFM74_00025, partial [Candidatus Limnocylindria bacterium]|nr:hypothetical protein [Candidatus Limnocylindria bacterium]
MTDSRRPADDRDPTDATAAQLERYAAATRDLPPPDFADTVMSRIEREPRPRRGWLGALLGAPGGWRRPMQVAALALVIVLGTGGALVGAELVGLVRTTAAPSPSVAPAPSVAPTTPSATPSPSPTATPSVSPSASLTPTPTPSAGGSSSQASATPGETAPEASRTPRASETPHPSETPRASD